MIISRVLSWPLITFLKADLRAEFWVIGDLFLQNVYHDKSQVCVRTKCWREKDGKAQPSLTWAMHDVIKWWLGGALNVIGDTS
jgi:hypothetical protein